MLKTMLFSGPSGPSRSWVLQFNGAGLNLYNIHLGENGRVYVGGEAYRYFSDTEYVRNIFSAGIEGTGRISWQNFFGDIDDTTSKRSEDGCITAAGSDVIVGGQEIVNSGVKGLQLCLYSVYGDELRTKVIKENGGSGVSIGGITSGGDYVYAYGEMIAKLTKNLSEAIWIKAFDLYEMGGVTVNTNNGNIYFCGHDFGSSPLFICSLSSTGTTRWLKKVGKADEEGTGICVNNGKVYVCGNTDKYEHSRGIIVTYTESGSSSWKKEVYYDDKDTHLNGISADITGNIYAVGFRYGTSSLGYFIKLSPSGSVLLNIEITGNIGGLRSIQIDAEGNIYLLSPIYVVKLTKNDIESITVSPLSIGPLTFTKGSTKVESSSLAQTSLSGNLERTDQYTLTSSTFTSREANLASKLYKG